MRNKFLEAVKAAMEDRLVDWTEPISEEGWSAFFKYAAEQNVLPLVYMSIYKSVAFQMLGAEIKSAMKRKVMQDVILQVRKTEECCNLYRALSEAGLRPLVVKGIICRNLYPNPDNRPSGDEDFYIPEGTFEQYHQALLHAGMKVAEWDEAIIDTSHELSYVNPNGVLCIELHKSLFESGNIQSRMNDSFIHAFERSIDLEFNKVHIRTMNYSDHLLFLILHAFKHFIGSGFGIRQVCDMVMFANAYGEHIDWEYILGECRKINADIFAASLFEIGQRYLNFDREKACYPAAWITLAVEPEELLDDLLDAGVFGASDMSRKHSSNITLNAVSANNEGKTEKGSVLKTIFPPVKVLENRFTYLQKYPFLLPIAWMSRIWQYKKEISKTENNDALSSIQIGQQRVAMMKKYGVIKE